MYVIKALAALAGLAVAASAGPVTYSMPVPHLDVPACNDKATIVYSKSVPDKTAFPKTQVNICYDPEAINIDFIAYDEKYYFYNSSLTTNDPIYNYEVMEAFIYHGTNNPSTYMEFEVAPNNVTFNAFIYNPSKVRAEGAPFDTLFIQTPQVDELTSTTVLDKAKHMWVSHVRIPLAFFSVDKPSGTNWRMNFFRTVVNPKTPETQLLGAWNLPDAPNFHKTPFFGNVHFS